MYVHDGGMNGMDANTTYGVSTTVIEVTYYGYTK